MQSLLVYKVKLGAGTANPLTPPDVVALSCTCVPNGAGEPLSTTACAGSCTTDATLNCAFATVNCSHAESAELKFPSPA